MTTGYTINIFPRHIHKRVTADVTLHTPCIPLSPRKHNPPSPSPWQPHPLRFIALTYGASGLAKTVEVTGYRGHMIGLRQPPPLHVPHFFHSSIHSRTVGTSDQHLNNPDRSIRCSQRLTVFTAYNKCSSVSKPSLKLNQEQIV